MEELSEEEKESRRRQIFIIILVVFLAIALIVTLGWLFRKEQIRKVEEEKEKKIKRLAEVELKIRDLQERKDKIERREKKILIGARIGIGLILIVANCWYKCYFIEHFNLGDILNFNGAILMGYAFLAFVTYGTIGNFVSALKLKFARILRRKHIDSLEGLEALIKEREQLKNDIDNLNGWTDKPTI
jgi:hypothetical protein